MAQGLAAMSSFTLCTLEACFTSLTNGSPPSLPPRQKPWSSLQLVLLGRYSHFWINHLCSEGTQCSEHPNQLGGRTYCSSTKWSLNKQAQLDRIDVEMQQLNIHLAPSLFMCWMHWPAPPLRLWSSLSGYFVLVSVLRSGDHSVP